MKSYKFVKLIAGIALLGTVVVGGSSLAWFTNAANIGPGGGNLPIESGTESGYFAYGNGSSDDPYGIKTPRQLYNLAWLQYLGLIHLDTQQLYFELADNLNMTGWVLPPVGTEDNPFIGNFNGNGYVVSNLTVSNEFSRYNTHPTVISGWDDPSDEDAKNFQPHILGVFGVIGPRQGLSDYESSINEFVDTGLTGITIESYVSDSLIGIAAGYAYDADLDDNYTTLSNILVDNSTIKLNKKDADGHTLPYGDYTDNISDYSLVGYTNNVASVNKASETMYGINTDTNITFNATEDGTSNGWGGSIDMKSVFTRLQRIRDNYSTSSTYNYKQTYYHHADGTVDNPTPTEQTGSNVRLVVDDTNHKEWGHYNFAYDSHSSNWYKNSYAQLGGGHLREDNYYEYTTHSAFQITNGTQYLKINSGNIDKTTTQSDGTYWYLSNENYLVTHIGDNFYYLRNNNGTLETVTSTANATVWTIDNSGAYRVISSVVGTTRYAITYSNNNFILVTGTATGQTIYSIRYQNNGGYLSNDGTTIQNSPTAIKKWYFSSLTGTTTISTKINGTTYYLRRATGNGTALQLTTSSYNWTWGTVTSGGTTYYTLRDTNNTNYYIRGYNNNWVTSNSTSNTGRRGITREGEAEYSYSTNITKSANNGIVSGPDEQIDNSQQTRKMDYSGDDVTYFPLSTVNDTDNFNPAENNTAYITASYNIPTGASASNFTSAYTNVRFAQSFYLKETTNSNGQTVKPAISEDDFDKTNGVFKKIYTVDDSGSRQDITSELTNEDTELTRLKDSTSALGNVLKTSNNADERVYGVHFMASTISMNAITTAKYVSMNNVPNENYQLPVNCIDFNLKEYGFITFIAGTYYKNSSTDRNNSFFALYQIERKLDKPKEINRILEIKNVYQHKDKPKTYSYVYELTDGTNTFFTRPYKITSSAGGKEFLDGRTDVDDKYVNTKPTDYTISLFNTDRIKTNSIAEATFDYHPYFFQIPMNDGEFCLGSVNGGIGAYLMYLDIGANAAKTTRTVFYEHFSLTNTSYSFPVGVCLMALTMPSTPTSGVPIIDVDNLTADYSDTACVRIEADCFGSFNVDRNSTTEVTLTRSNTSNAPPVFVGDKITFIHELNSQTNIVPTPESSITQDFKRMQYYDYMVNTDTLVVTTITDITTTNNLLTTNNTSSKRTITQSKYSGKNVDPDKLVSTPLVYDGSGSQAALAALNNMRIYRHTNPLTATDNGKRYTSTEVLDLVIPSGKISSSNPILVLSMPSVGANGINTEVTLLVEIDDSISSTDVFYSFDNYSIKVSSNGDGSITLTVASCVSSFDISIANIAIPANSTSQTVTITNASASSSSGVWTITFVIPEPEPENEP